MKRCRGILLRLAVVVMVVLGEGSGYGSDTTPLKQLSFLPQWQPQAQFVGFYMALHKGYYQDHGLDVDLIQGGPNAPPVTWLKEDKADVVTLWLSTALQLADQGVDLVNVGQLIQRSALMLAAKKSSGIHTPADMKGVKIAVWPADFQIQPKAFCDKFDLKTRLVTTENPVRLFLRDGVQVASLMWYNEYHTLILCGLDPERMNLFFFDQFGLNFPEDGLYLKKTTFDRDRPMALAFATASMQGWHYSFTHSEEAVDLMVTVMQAAHLPANRTHQRWMLERIRDLSAVDAHGAPMGVLRKEDYQQVGDILKSYGLIGTTPSYEDFVAGTEVP